MSRAQGYAKGRATRERILDAAETAFGEVGFRGASLREIAQRVGLSHPGLLHHFPSKEALLLAVLERRDEVDRARIEQEEGGAARLRRLVEVVGGGVERRAIIELFAVMSVEATNPDHPAHQYFDARYRRVVAEIADSYRDADSRGELIASLDPDQAAITLVALMDGLQVQWLYHPELVDLGAALTRHLDGQLRTALDDGVGYVRTGGAAGKESFGRWAASSGSTGSSTTT